jgi:hypothetical protein
MDLINDPRNSFPKTFFTNGYVDVLKTKYIIKYKKIHGNNVYPFKTPDPHDIDNIDKLGYLEYLLK